jgi:DNA-directed RNA polymerase specialized sigma24 family protein
MGKREKSMTQSKDEYEMSQQKIAEEMLLCKNTVMKVEKRALEKLRKALEKRGIKPEDILGDR